MKSEWKYGSYENGDLYIGHTCKTQRSGAIVSYTWDLRSPLYSNRNIFCYECNEHAPKHILLQVGIITGINPDMYYFVASRFLEVVNIIPADARHGIRKCGCYSNFSSESLVKCKKHKWMCAIFWLSVLPFVIFSSFISNKILEFLAWYN